MKKLFTTLTLLMLIGWSSTVMAQAFTFTSGQLSYSENFDGMGPEGTTYLNGWTAVRYAGTGAIGETLVIVVTDGSANSGAIYNVGAVMAADRSFGPLGSGSTVPRFGASFLNNTGSGITEVALAGVMEQWRSGSNSSINEVNAFEYSLDATDLSSGTWVAVSSFDLNEKIISSTTAAALDGNLAENQTAINATISGLNWTPGANLWIRWSDVNDTGSDGICAIDNMTMTVTTGTVSADPEPSNYPSSFNATSAGTTITASWADATGTQLPAGYLVKINLQNASVSLPVDGTFEPDELDFTDSKGAKNVPFGQQNYTFSGLPSGAYKLTIFPYTNGGTLVDYKTDGTAPTATAATQIVVSATNFDTDLSPWTQISTTGTQTWISDLTHGVNGSGCAKMSGFETGASFANEDWLISPAIDLSNMINTKMQFYSAYNYAGDPLSILISTDYTSGDPSVSGTWNDVSSSAVFSAGGWAWTPSGFINLGVENNPNLHIAFHYTSNTTEARTWEIDEVVVTGSLSDGLKGDHKTPYETQVFPNPCSSEFNVFTPGNGKFGIIVSDAMGAVVSSIITTDKASKIQTSGMNPGIYFVKITNHSNGLNEVHKLVVR